MGIVAAIARVRAGAKSAGLEGALNSLGAELKSEVIPERLRDVAGRLAALLGNPGASPPGPTPMPVPSLEVALDAHAHARSAAGADAVCPFTGLRADEMGLGSAPLAVVPVVAAPDAISAEVEERRSAREQSSESKLEAREQDSAQAPAAVLPAAETPSAARVDATKAASAAPRAAEAKAPVREPTKADEPAVGARRARTDTGNREKRKERLAGASSVANTSGRSATRPAAKRPRSRTDSTRKKT
jgi:hypothetical protein